MPNTSSDDINNATSSARAREASPLKNLDQYAGEVRDASQLSEPLADSVLEYSLFRLQPTSAVVHSGSIQELEEAMSMGQSEHLMEQEPGDTQAYSQLPGPAPSRPVPDWMRTTPQNFAPQPYPFDWWGIGLDALQPPILPYDQLLGFNGTV